MEKTGKRRGAAAFAAVLLFSAGAAALAGCGEKAGPAPPAARPPVQGVEVAAVSLSEGERTVEAPGTVRGRNIAYVAPQVMGRVVSLDVSEGSAVSKGDLLVAIDDEAIRAEAASAEGTVAEAVAAGEEAERAVAQAEAEKELAEKRFARFERLRREEAVTRQEFEEVETKRTVAAKEKERALERKAQAAARVAAARGRADAARAMLSYTKVTAPFSGVVTEKRTEVGSMAVPGTPLLVLEDTRRYRIEAPVPEAWISRLSVGMRVQAMLDSAGEDPFPAVVSEIAPLVDPMSRTFMVKADIARPGLRTGMYGRLRFSAGKGTVLAVPGRAITRSGGYDGVFVVTPDNVARLTMVRTGARAGDRVEILSGLEPGSRVAVSRVERLADGVRVETGK